MMGVARAGGGGLVLGLGTTSGQVFLVSIVSDNLLWLPLEVPDTSGKRRVKCLSWLVKSPDQLYLATGYSGGLVAVWRIDLNKADSQVEHSVVGRLQDTKADITLTSWAPDERVQAVGTVMGEVVFYVSGPGSSSGWQCSQKLGCGGSAITCAAWMTNSRIEHSVVGRLQDTKADITLTSWAPDNRVLAVGTVMGEVVFYVSGPDSSSGWQCSQKLGCGGSAITCAAWMTNSSILAVGGTDDSIHILQRRQSPVTSTPTNTQSSLFSYCETTSPVTANSRNIFFLHSQASRCRQVCLHSLAKRR
ncbi:hypothetical protein GBAR_LOCUS2753 [Geodia barretti]|uniref:Uncharacterized protein n=1 Tax=Geodia barretti TaxID=519541 RepID=A0AA35R2B4_GEOBA|nr:hypothetical protein GBAR_LOCUS2753 [Geodia barretti]